MCFPVLVAEVCFQPLKADCGEKCWFPHTILVCFIYLGVNFVWYFSFHLSQWLVFAFLILCLCDTSMQLLVHDLCAVCLFIWMWSVLQYYLSLRYIIMFDTIHLCILAKFFCFTTSVFLIFMLHVFSHYWVTCVRCLIPCFWKHM